MKVLPSPPEHLDAQASAALAYFSEAQGSEFKITGFVPGPDDESANDATDLQLILCGIQNGQDVCLKERFLVSPGSAANDFDVTHVTETELEVGSPAPELDPPEGTRFGWLDKVMADSEFTVLLFYRGLW